MGVKESLKNNGLSDEVIESIISEMNKENSLKSVPKDQYNKISKELAESRGNAADLEAKITNLNTDEFKIKYEELEKTHNDFVSNIETEKVNGSKSSTLKTLLAKEGVNKKLIPLLLKEFDLGTIELENDTVKGWEEIVKPIKDNYSDFFTVQSTEGNPPLTPPGGGNGGQQGNETDPLALALGKLL